MGDNESCEAGGGPVRMVNLVSGGLDSTLVAVLAMEEGLDVFPLFIDYGQRAAMREWETCLRVHSQLGLSEPTRVDVSGFGHLIRSGLTTMDLDIKKDAFVPGRNLMFALIGGCYAYQVEAPTVAIGLLSERYSLFPDQTRDFVKTAELAIATALGRHLTLATPLFEFTKADVIHLAGQKGISGTYSCHEGGELPCGRCISCLEFQSSVEEE